MANDRKEKPKGKPDLSPEALSSLRKIRKTPAHVARFSLTLCQKGSRPIRIVRNARSPLADYSICLSPDGKVPEGMRSDNAFIAKDMKELELLLAAFAATPETFSADGSDPLDGCWAGYEDDPEGEDGEDIAF